MTRQYAIRVTFRSRLIFFSLLCITISEAELQLDNGMNAMNTMKQNALPISIKEFADALFKKPCQVPYRHDQRGHRTLGMDFMMDSYCS